MNHGVDSSNKNTINSPIIIKCQTNTEENTYNMETDEVTHHMEMNYTIGINREVNQTKEINLPAITTEEITEVTKEEEEEEIPGIPPEKLKYHSRTT